MGAGLEPAPKKGPKAVELTLLNPHSYLGGRGGSEVPSAYPPRDCKITIIIRENKVNSLIMVWIPTNLLKGGWFLRNKLF